MTSKNFFSKKRLMLSVAVLVLTVAVSLFFIIRNQNSIHGSPLSSVISANHISWSAIGQILSSIPTGEKWISIQPNAGPMTTNQSTNVISEHNTVWQIDIPPNQTGTANLINRLSGIGGFFGCHNGNSNIVCYEASSLLPSAKTNGSIVIPKDLYKLISGIDTTPAVQTKYGYVVNTENIFFKNMSMSNQMFAILKIYNSNPYAKISATIYPSKQTMWTVAVMFYAKK